MGMGRDFGLPAVVIMRIDMQNLAALNRQLFWVILLADGSAVEMFGQGVDLQLRIEYTR